MKDLKSTTLFKFSIIVFFISSTINGTNITCDYINNNIFRILLNTFINICVISSNKEIHFSCSNETLFSGAYLSIIGKQKILFDSPIDFKNYNNSFQSAYYIYLTISKGFNVNSTLATNGNKMVKLFISESDFEFYFNDKIIDSKFCVDKDISFIVFSNVTLLKLQNSVKFRKTAYCPFIFNNSYLNELDINNLYDTEFLKNTYYFMDINKTDIHGSILYSSFSLYNYKLDENFLYKDIYGNTSMTLFKGTISSIDKELFKNLINLRKIYFILYHASKFITKSLDWMNPINENIKVREDNDSLEIYLQNNSSNVKFIGLYFLDYLFNDVDLCLFKDFPFFRAIYPVIFEHSAVCSCTYIWLSKYFYIYEKYFKLMLAGSWIEYQYYGLNDEIPYQCNLTLIQYLNCSFDIKLKNCFNNSLINSIKREDKHSRDVYYQDLEINLAQYELISTVFVSPLFSLIGIIFGLLILKVLRHKYQKNYFEKIFSSILR